MTNKCVRCLVSGRVQGVWYRGSTQDRAIELGVAGYASNLADGRVEVFACGPADAVDALVDWLAVGPPLAAVVDVVVEDADVHTAGDGFVVR